jgi:hypothetical protein
MAIASHFFIGSPVEAERNDGLEGGDAARRAVFYRVTDLNLKPLYQILTGNECPSFVPAVMSDDYTQITLKFPSEFVVALAKVEAAEIPPAIARWRADESTPYDNDQDLLDLLTALNRLARSASAASLDLYLWVCV